MPGDARSSPHCTDIARGLGVPVLHANADDPEAVVQVRAHPFAQAMLVR